MEFMLRTTISADLEVFFTNQLDEESNYMAAFSAEDPNDKVAYMEKWTRLLLDDTAHLQTVIYNDDVAGVIAKYAVDEKFELIYWIGKRFWGRGVATKALDAFLKLEPHRPLYSRVAFDNRTYLSILEKSGFKRTGSEIRFAQARGVEIEELILKLD